MDDEESHSLLIIPSGHPDPYKPGHFAQYGLQQSQFPGCNSDSTTRRTHGLWFESTRDPTVLNFNSDTAKYFCGMAYSKVTSFYNQIGPSTVLGLYMLPSCTEDDNDKQGQPHEPQSSSDKIQTQPVPQFVSVFMGWRHTNDQDTRVPPNRFTRTIGIAGRIVGHDRAVQLDARGGVTLIDAPRPLFSMTPGRVEELVSRFTHSHMIIVYRGRWV
ncbi:hypothetical protein AAF712_013250 [Marasmius tenuissimus]|uniref:Uncharacterized protein n=1 Tax=Marasmius tenuissimus TaxID=585030 RepID=A0ABR2ZG72_9AGAR